VKGNWVTDWEEKVGRESFDSRNCRFWSFYGFQIEVV
jgi:hypothetical protein